LKSIHNLNNPYGDDKVIDACSIFGMIDNRGYQLEGHDIVESMTNMNQRTNGLGSGFAVYGIYPKYRNNYAVHIMFDDKEALNWGSNFLNSNFVVIKDEEIPTDRSIIKEKVPIMWRYFIKVEDYMHYGISEEEYILQKCLDINTSSKGSYVFSNGKNMGIFKGVGWPREIADFFQLNQYKGHIWIAHGRFPTNTPGWWGGAHPFSLLDYSIVHNGEISSYGTNRRFLELMGYKFSFHTDTEVFAFALDLLIRKHNLSVDIVAKIFSPPFWKEIDKLPPDQKRFLQLLRITYSGLMINGPFSIIFANQNMMVGLTDRIKLRPLIAASGKNVFFISSEESAIRAVCPDLDYVNHPRGGEPIIARSDQISSTESPVLSEGIIH
jgi:glutamate synthase domain-containing protein 1